jgi:uncharacterized membrane protein YfcA
MHDLPSDLRRSCGQVVWSAAAVMAIGALMGGVIGGRLANKLPPSALRRTVVIAGIGIAMGYWVKSE